VAVGKRLQSTKPAIQRATSLISAFELPPPPNTAPASSPLEKLRNVLRLTVIFVIVFILFCVVCVVDHDTSHSWPIYERWLMLVARLLVLYRQTFNNFCRRLSIKSNTHHRK
jgi:hypothetical protein